jgi:hypothetical protein
VIVKRRRVLPSGRRCVRTLLRRKVLPSGMRCAFRPSEEPTIAGLVMAAPPGLEPRLCVELLYDDGFVDHELVSEYSFAGGSIYEAVAIGEKNR